MVWFKRDLRMEDHQPLLRASESGLVLPLYIIEPELWNQADTSARQWCFIRECLQELQQALSAVGQPLVVRVGEALPVLQALHRQRGIAQLWSHEETGNGFTYARDRSVRRWLRQQGIPRQELQTFGVIRRLGDRNGWAPAWERQMALPCHPAPVSLMPLTGMECGGIPSADDLGLKADPCPDRQPGGRRAALALIDSFLTGRGHNYAKELSSPLTAFRSCSRLSAHLALGTVSMREVLQTARARKGSKAFIERLH